MFRKDPFLALYFSLFSSIIFWLLCHLPSATLFTLTIWPFGFPSPQSPLQWKPHKELCFDWSAGLSTSVFLPIQAIMRAPYSEWMATKLTSSPTFFYSAPASVSIQFQLFLGSPSTALFPFVSMYLRWRPSSSHVSRPYAVSVWRFSSALSHLCFTRMVFFLKRSNFTKLERIRRARSRAITGCLSSSPIPLLLSKVSLSPLRVTLTHFTLSLYEWAFRLPTSFPISDLARHGVKPRLCRSS